MKVGRKRPRKTNIMVLGFDLRYWLHLFLAYSYTFIFSNFPSPFYRGLSALYSLPSCILAFHLEGLDLFPLILVPSGLHWKASTLGYKLWWHCSGVISPLMWPAKWVQSIECKGDGCFIYIISFFTCDKSSSLSSVYAWWSLELVFDPPEDIRVSSGSSSIVVSLDLWWVAHIYLHYFLLYLR